MSLNRLKLPLYFNTKRHQNKWIVLKQSLKVSRTDWHTYRHIQYTSFAQFLYNTFEIYPAAFCTKWPIKLNFSPLWRWPLSLPQSHSSFSSWGKKQMTSSHYNPTCLLLLLHPFHTDLPSHSISLKHSSVHPFSLHLSASAFLLAVW